MSPSRPTSLERRGLVLAPSGRDASIAIDLLAEVGLFAERCASTAEVAREIERSAAFLVIAEEALLSADFSMLAAVISAQPGWSDFPVLLLIRRGGGIERNPVTLRLVEALGNVSPIERPFHPLTFASVVQSAYRSRLRQYQARGHLDELARRTLSLTESEDRFRTLADNMPDLCWMAEADGSIFWYNRRWYDYTGTTAEQMAGWGWQAVHHEKALPAVMNNWQRSIASGEPFEMTFPLRAADGSFHPFLTRISPLRNAQGAIYRWFGTNVDVSALLSAQAELRERSEDLQFVLDAGGLGAWNYDPQTDVLRASDYFKTLFGRSDSAPFSLHEFLASIHEDDRAERSRRVMQALEENGKYSVDYRIHHADGSERWVEDRGRTVLKSDGALQLAGVSIDITPRRRIEAQLRGLNEELEQRVAQRTQELERAQEDWKRAEEKLLQSQKMEAIGQLTGGIAHDFNNLLTGIIGGLGLIQRRLAEGRYEDLDRFINTAVNSANAAGTLTHRLLAFSRQQVLSAFGVSLNELIQSFDDLFRRTLGEQIVYRTQLASDLPNAHIDPHQFESALLNLVLNARDAMPQGGVLTVSTDLVTLDALAKHDLELDNDRYIAVSISDTGIGMSQEVLNRVFEPFFTTKPFGQGTGLGLPMVYGFVRQSRGEMRVDSHVGAGSTFHLYFPLEEQPEAEALPPSLPSVVPATGHRILLVEDETSVREIVGEVLREIGYELHSAGDAQQALAVLDAGHRIELLVTDVGLPGLNGRQLAELAQTRLPGLKVLYMTGYAQKALAGDETLDPKVSLIAKPFSLDDLSARIAQLLAN